MLRSTLVLVALSGCDVAFQLDHVDVQRAACGPYGGVRPVMITGVIEPRQFSISADEQLALVVGTDGQGVTRPIPLQWNGSAWEPHALYQAGLQSLALVGARLSPSEETPMNDSYVGPVQPAINGWLLNTNRHQVSRFYWTGTTWTVDTKQNAVYNAPDYDTHAGNVVLVKGADGNPDNRVRHTVITKLAVEAGLSNQIVLHANNLPEFNLLPKPDRTRTLNEESAATDVMLTDAVLTDNQATLVYAGVSGGQSDIYASAQSALREFGPGGVIAAVTTPDDEVEPWIDAACSKLYFRRIPAGSPNAAGQIYVAQ